MTTQQHVVDLLPDFLMGSFTEPERSSIQTHLKSCAACRKEYESLSMLWNSLSTLPEEKPSPAMRERFNAMLSAYEQGIRHGAKSSFWESLNAIFARLLPKQPAIQFALMLVLVVGGFTLGSRSADGIVSDGIEQDSQTEIAQLRGEVQAMSRMLAVSLLRQQSASERIKGASWTERLTQPDEQVLGTLVKTLNYDPNVNVRLAAMDALTKYAEEPEVRETFVESLTKQTSPLMQIALVEVIAELKIPGAASAFREILKSEQINETVKERIQQRLSELEE
ncbi:MAG: HEAT repeat domain-containing protein [Ignavibacteriae bacterium]|nr:HEAT repeat domain-containing protein [Ignavibacteriota bacterium]